MGLFSKIRGYFKKDDNHVAKLIVRNQSQRTIELAPAYQQFQRKEQEVKEKEEKERELQREQHITEFLDEKVLYGKALDNALFGLANDDEELNERLKIFIDRTVNNGTIVVGNKITQLTSSDFHYLADKFKEKIETLNEAAECSSGKSSQIYLSMAKNFTQAMYAIQGKYGIDTNEARRRAVAVAIVRTPQENLESRIEDTPWLSIAAS